MPKKYPNAADYDFAVTYLDRTVQSLRFKGGTPRKKKTGIGLFAPAGGYSRVYLIDFRQPKKPAKAALRCWTAEVTDAYRKYQTTAAYLGTRHLRYFVEYEYIPSGIIVNNERYPITYMEWVEGRTLDKYIDENISNPQALTFLADEFLTMVKELHANKIAHGDLQDGNILVVSNNNGIFLKLIDYDSLFVPGLENFPDQIKGLPAYQSPNRGDNKFLNPTLDYFSELIIYLSLLIYSEKPGQWKKGQQDRELVFSEADLLSPRTSAAFTMALSLSPKVRYLTRKAVDFCHIRDIRTLPSLETVIREGEQLGWHIGAIVPTPLTILPKQTLRGRVASSTVYSNTKRSSPIKNIKQVPSNSTNPNTNKATYSLIRCRVCGEVVQQPASIYCPNGHAIYGMVRCPNCSRQIPYKAVNCPRCKKATGW
ncbi:MAG: protein kinase family protein [Anaerolineales bacterium]|nr:protein kinase family protein [Anaerolineales bacterium]